MKAPLKADLIRMIDFRKYVHSVGEDIVHGFAYAIPRNENGEVDFYWRSKKAMLRYFRRCREINPTCRYPVILFFSKLFPQYTWKQSDVIRIHHRWFEKNTIKTFVVEA
jgi:hypothetical protein